MIPADFPWRAGMLSLQHGIPARLVGQDDAGRWNALDRLGVWLRYTSLDGIEPDLSDPATIGALAGAVREAYRSPFLTCVPNVGFDLFPTTWAVVEGHGERVTDHLPTEGEAWLAAWNGRAK